MTLYNLSSLQNATSISDVAVSANTFSGGILFGGFIIAIFIILLFQLKRYDFDNALLASSFVSFILSTIAAFGGFITLYFPISFLVILVLTALYVYMVK